MVSERRASWVQTIVIKSLKTNDLRGLRFCFGVEDGWGSKIAIKGVRRGLQNQVAVCAFAKVMRNLSLYDRREFSL
jgi:hypothetical protein